MTLMIFMTTMITDNQRQTTVKREREKTRTKQKTECVSGGNIVCAKREVWYLAHVFTQNEIPEHVLQKLTKNIQGKLFVKCWGEDNFSVITESNVEPLAQNKVDEHRPTRSSQMPKAHHSALSEVIAIQYKHFMLSCGNIIILLYLDCTLFTSWE